METATPSIESLIRQYLPTKHLMQLATVRDGQPWCCTVHYYADGLNLYWVSFTNSRHSQEIADHSRVAAAIAVETDGPPVGIQVEGDARTVNDEAEARRILPAYIKHNDKPAQTYDKLIESGAHLYRLTPRRFVLFDTRDLTGNPRREWQPE
jgi:uncharacterized protein YhbP (UPF0306 family)